MRNVKWIIILFLTAQSNFAQTVIKGNLVTALVAVPNFGIETKLSNKTSFQVDFTASFWKSVNNAPQEFGIIIPEFRYHTKEFGNGFFVGAHLGGSIFKVQKWNYANQDYYQKGFGILIGATIGYQFQVSDIFGLEVFIGGGSQQGFYKGYKISDNSRVDLANKYNKSGEVFPYRGGLMLVYKL
jgi:hypothetical protein